MCLRGCQSITLTLLTPWEGSIVTIVTIVTSGTGGQRADEPPPPSGLLFLHFESPGRRWGFAVFRSR
jgi:hypothetical protein